jgi:hypothetical protein
MVNAQTNRILELEANGLLSIEDSIMLGAICAVSLDWITPLSDKAWEAFIRIANETRELWQIPHEPSSGYTPISDDPKT